MSYYYNQSQGQEYYAQGQEAQQQSYGGHPRVPAPWIAEWDPQNDRWLYINRETGQRTFETPQESSYVESYGGDYGTNYARQSPGDYYPQEPPQESHTRRNMALGAGAGIVGGALLMHEGGKVGR